MASGTLPVSFPVPGKYHNDLRHINDIEPHKTGGYSQDASGDYHDGEKPRYVVTPSQNSLDLNLGFDDNYKNTYLETKMYMDDLLRWIMKHTAEIGSLKGKFVSRGSAIYTLMAAACDTSNAWIVDVTLYNGTYYMYAVDTEDTVQRREAETREDERRSYWGLKFEHYLTADSPESEPDISRQVKSSEGSYVVMTANIQNHEMVYASEVDGYDASNEAIELKTVTRLQERNPNFKKFKLLKWYLKAKIAGVSKVKAGVVNDHGIVDAGDMIDYSMDSMEQQGKKFWKPKVCYNSANELLKQMTLYVMEDNASIVYRFAYDAKHTITVTKHDSEHVILPMWYTGKSGRDGTEQDVQAENHEAQQ